MAAAAENFVGKVAGSDACGRYLLGCRNFILFCVPSARGAAPYLGAVLRYWVGSIGTVWYLDRSHWNKCRLARSAHDERMNMQEHVSARDRQRAWLRSYHADDLRTSRRKSLTRDEAIESVALEAAWLCAAQGVDVDQATLRREAREAWRKVNGRPRSSRVSVPPVKPSLPATSPRRSRDRSSRRSHTAATRRRSSSGAGDDPPGEPSITDELTFLEATAESPTVIRAKYAQAGRIVEAWARPTGFVFTTEYAGGALAPVPVEEAIARDLPGQLAAIDGDPMWQYVEGFAAALDADAIRPDDFRGVGS